MKETLRQSMGWLHTWCGLLFGWVLFGVLLTGSLAVFYTELNLWATPELRSPIGIDRAQAVGLGRDYLTREAPDARQWRIVIPTDREPVLRLVWTDAEGIATTHRLDPLTGVRIPRDMDAGFFFMRYHYTLGISRSDSQLGFLIVGAAGLAMLAAIISGIIIHKRIFRDFFVFRPRKSKQRAWMDAHNVLSVLPLPFHAMMAYTGLIILYYAYIPAAVDLLHAGDLKSYQRDAAMAEYVDVPTPPGPSSQTIELMPLVAQAEREWGGEPAVNIYISHPNRTNAAVEIWSQRDHRISNFPHRVAFDGVTGERLRTLTSRSAARDTQAFLAGLHFVEWGGGWVRWLYFLAGLASTAMVATALVLFVAKRERRNAFPRLVLPLIKTITVAAVAGNIVACVAYLLAERYYPAGISDRRSLLATVYFMAWLAMLAHAGLRPYRKAWVEQLGLAALLCLILPFTSMAAGIGLNRTLSGGDWIRAGVDLTAWISAMAFGAAAWKVAPPGRQTAGESGR